jgi:membrane-bound lytic murein transglycosylase D
MRFAMTAAGDGARPGRTAAQGLGGQRWLILSSFLIFYLVVSPAATAKVGSQTSTADQTPFPISPLIDRQVWFWELIFAQYESHHVVLHDGYYPHVIVDVIDLNEIRESRPILADLSDDAIVDDYLERYSDGLKKFASEGPKAALHSAIEKRIYESYSIEPETREHLLSGKPYIRAQKGLHDRFQKAAQRAQRYLPHMEKIFRSHELPIGLTRLPFVESMFNMHARSKVGASGVWQFMPATARRFLIVNRDIDERNSPWKATRAAARLMAHNYNHLKSWPLAVTAYNHGLYGIKRAVSQVNSRSLEEIIRRYQSSSFGFASRNFYTEFLAAMRIYEREYNHLRQKIKPFDVVPVRLPKRLAVDHLIRHTPLTYQMLEEWNPCLSSSYFRRNSNRRIPKHYELMVPQQFALRTKKALKRL